MLGRNPARPFFPTLDRWRESGSELTLHEPQEHHKLAALMVAAQLHDMRYHQVKGMFETYLPGELQKPALLGLETRLVETTTPGENLPPSVLRCHDLRPVQSGGAYRAARTTKQPDFWGHKFSDTIEQAGEALQRFFLGTRPRSYDIFAYAWPLLWLRFGHYEQSDAVVWIDRKGELQCYESQPVDEG